MLLISSERLSGIGAAELSVIDEGRHWEAVNARRAERLGNSGTKSALPKKVSCGLRLAYRSRLVVGCGEAKAGSQFAPE